MRVGVEGSAVVVYFRAYSLEIKIVSLGTFSTDIVLEPSARRVQLTLFYLFAVALICQAKSSKTVSACSSLSVVVFTVGAYGFTDSVSIEEEPL